MDAINNQLEKRVFNAILEEACRQWCEFIEDAPERKDGKGFAHFFYEILEEKEKEYQEYYSNDLLSEGKV